MRIAIVGTGGVGGYLGAKLWKAGHELLFLARGEHLARMQQHGLLLESVEGNIRVQADFTDSAAGREPCDLIIIAVKSYDTTGAADIIRPIVRQESTILSIQNGVENEDLLASLFGAEKILGGVALIISIIASPGVVRHSGGTGVFKFGEMDGSISSRCKELEAVFQSAEIRATAVENLPKSLWEKWVFICGVGGMTAWARSTIGEILASASHRHMLEQVIHEAAEVARARGVDPFVGLEEKTMGHIKRLSAESTSSMYYDLTHGKRLEIEALNGAAVRFGRTLNVPTPANEKIYQDLLPFAGN